MFQIKLINHCYEIFILYRPENSFHHIFYAKDFKLEQYSYLTGLPLRFWLTLTKNIGPWIIFAIQFIINFFHIITVSQWAEYVWFSSSIVNGPRVQLEKIKGLLHLVARVPYYHHTTIISIPKNRPQRTNNWKRPLRHPAWPKFNQ